MPDVVGIGEVARHDHLTRAHREVEAPQDASENLQGDVTQRQRLEFPSNHIFSNIHTHTHIGKKKQPLKYSILTLGIYGSQLT